VTVRRPALVGVFGALLSAPLFLSVNIQAAELQTSQKSSATQPAPAKKPSAKKKRRSRPRTQQAPTPERIREIQEALARAGHLDAEPTGKWDAATIAAVKSFQQAKGLAVTGKLDARTLQRLGLGSEVAGQAPPRLPATANGSTSRP
jgi:peptidoglycan hydrolase-like protein with peptidoglycan-binding domain